jgi:hypothetical protein
MFLGQTTAPSEGSPIPYDDDRTENMPGSDSATESDVKKPELATKSSTPTDNTVLYLLGAAAIYFLFLRKK